MRLRRSDVVAVALAALVGAGSFWVSADAHRQRNYYETKWRRSHHTGVQITWRFTPRFPDTRKKARIRDAFRKWNKLGEPMRFVALGEAKGTYNPFKPVTIGACPSQDYNGVFERTRVQFGATIRCLHNNGVPHHFSIVMDKRDDWWAGKQRGPQRRNDYMAVAVHEVGHATGFVGPQFGHFPSGQAICRDDFSYQTMCNGQIPAPYKMRSLEGHDRHTFRTAY